MTDYAILAAVAARRQELIGLTQDLIRIPTLNPPGQHYRWICDYLAARLEAAGFTLQFIRAIGAPGDSEAYPRWNLIARIELRSARRLRTFQRPSRCG